METRKTRAPLSLPNARVLIVAARYYADIVDTMITGAERTINAAGARLDVIDIPGAFEAPGAVALAALSNRYDGFVALGCVVRGETSHYDYVCGESARGLMDLSVRAGLAIGYGILTVENLEQAWARAALDRGDKGGESAYACLSMIALARHYGSQSS